jgi:hypothetical protein
MYNCSVCELSGPMTEYPLVSPSFRLTTISSTMNQMKPMRKVKRENAVSSGALLMTAVMDSNAVLLCETVLGMVLVAVDMTKTNGVEKDLEFELD